MLLSCGSNKNSTSKVITQHQEKISMVDEAVIQVLSSIETDSLLNKPETIKDSIEKGKINQISTKEFTSIHTSWNELLKKHVSEQGTVNYKGFKNDRLKLLDYFKTLNQSLPKETDSKAYTLAYWINAYNAFTIDLILRHYPIKSIKDIKKPWDQRYWKLGEKWYNLNDIEHEILRKMNEPRIHFAIVCASISCPKLQNKAFTPSHLELQLFKATDDFLNDHTRNSLSENSVELSKIFQWFAKDFKKNESLIDFLNQYSTIKISAKAKTSYKHYNWDLNE
jgi:hypothetical protein